jgi:hypothetical protein
LQTLDEALPQVGTQFPGVMVVKGTGEMEMGLGKANVELSGGLET